MKTKIVFLSLLLCLAACTTVPLTGRKQLSLIPAPAMISLSEQNYRQALSQGKLSSNSRETARLRQVGNRLIQAVERYMKQEGLYRQIEGYEWEINLLESKEANAWCMEGGKIAFYSGILPLCPSDDAIAVVMSHEIAHAIARHGRERMSQLIITQMGGVAIDQALREKPVVTRQLAQTAYGAGSTIGVLLPFSRAHESEADEMGLHFMAMAGYNPDEAIRFWERMSQMSRSKTPAFLSTHPAPEDRIRQIKRLIPEVKAKYRP
jgi:predicted Zn-dependent protease